MTTDFRALCAELTDALDWINCSFNVLNQSALVERARDALAEPEPASLSDEELWHLFCRFCREDFGNKFMTYDRFSKGARAVEAATLARAQRQPEPVPTVEGEVGELIKCLRIRAASLSKVGANLSQRGDAIYFTRAADLLEQRQPVEPLPGEVEHG